MPIHTKTTCLGFLLSVAALTTPVTAEASLEVSNSSLESRLSRLTHAMQQRQIDNLTEKPHDSLLARGWADGNRGNWVNTNRGGFGDRYGGGGFVNRNWGDGGRFYNNYGGGGFVNRY